LRLLQPKLIVAVGRCADRGLTSAGVEHVSVRHPSQGGANAFREQLSSILAGKRK
jgi:hypothetical protein